MKVVRFALAACLLFLALVGGGRMSAQISKALLLFGGEDHKTFLGCLNCNQFKDDSVCNRFGKFGSKFETDSIWNQFGTFGSKFNEFSPWNKFSSKAPIIVDEDGKSYGYFSMNTFHPDRTKIKWLVKILEFQDENDDLDVTRDKMCGD